MSGAQEDEQWRKQRENIPTRKGKNCQNSNKIYKRYRLKCNKEYTSNFRKENKKEKMHLKQTFPIYIMHKWYMVLITAFLSKQQQHSE